ncbi:MAG: metal-dependent transcriptional regulator [Planctomycetaceae bacterium]|nr:metal-dependent transcriptional regulator [Planctomycetaceae bacterium]
MHETVKVTPVLEDYLEAIFNLSRDERGARSRDIADALNVHKSTVTSALRALKQMQLIHYSPYEAVNLTEAGSKIAADVVRRHETLRGFFTDVLGVDPETSEKAACGMEHSMPREIVEKLAIFAEEVRDHRKQEKAE